MGLTRESTHKGDPVGREVELTPEHTGTLVGGRGREKLLQPYAMDMHGFLKI